MSIAQREKVRNLLQFPPALESYSRRVDVEVESEDDWLTNLEPSPGEVKVRMGMDQVTAGVAAGVPASVRLG